MYLSCLGQYNDTSLDCGISSTVSNGPNCLCGVSAPTAGMLTHGTSTSLKPSVHTQQTPDRHLSARYDGSKELATGLAYLFSKKT